MVPMPPHQPLTGTAPLLRSSRARHLPAGSCKPLAVTGQSSCLPGKRRLLCLSETLPVLPCTHRSMPLLVCGPLLPWQLSMPDVPACVPGWLARIATCALLQAAAAFPMWPEGLARPTKAHSDPSVLQTIVVDLQASALRLTYRNPVVEQRYQKWYAEQVARVSWGFTGRRCCEWPFLYA